MIAPLLRVRSDARLSKRELERLTRRFVCVLGTNIGPEHDVAMQDMGTDARTMAWVVGTHGGRSGSRKER